VTNQVAVQIKKAIGQGADQIRIQLKPAELGAVEVKLAVTEDGRAMAVVSVERPETLDLLQRDANGLRQALQDAGLSTDSNSLSFNLRGEGGKFGQELAERGHALKNNDDETANSGDDEETNAAEAASIAAQTAAADAASTCRFKRKEYTPWLQQHLPIPTQSQERRARHYRICPEIWTTSSPS
jgi:flagellar hook-length control protein FliK